MTNNILARKSLLLLSLVLLLQANFSHAHSGSSTSAAWEVCDNKEKSQSCEYKNHHGDRYIGTCQIMLTEHMLCVRNKPIIPAPDKDSESDHSSDKSPTEKSDIND